MGFIMARRSHRISLCNHMILLILSVTHMSQSVTFKKVTLNFINDNQETWAITLKEKDSFLANEYTPVWLENESNPCELILQPQMMKNIGQFSMYYNRELSSAAAYFHNLNAMYGTIDIRYIIHEIAIENEGDQDNVRSKLQPVMLRQKFSRHKKPQSKSTKTRDLPLLLHSSRKFGENLLNDTQSNVRLRRTLPEIIYIKILVIINCDLFEEINNGKYGKIGILQYVLTLFNSVDMLFSKIYELDIKINIAGIIIRTNHKEFSSLQECHHVDLARKKYIKGFSIYPALQSLLKKYSEEIPVDSYHFSVFLSSHAILSKSLDKDERVAGMTLYEDDDYYGIKMNSKGLLPIIIIQENQYFGSFYTIAHEITHALGFHSHDEGPYLDEQNACIAHIMKPHSDICHNCLTWSPHSIMMLTQIFSSRDGCFFIKEPLSLETPKIRQIWTADEQCQCYGFDRAISPGTIEKICAQNLECIDSDHVVYEAPIPLDGTPCDNDLNGVSKVCWNKRCRHIG